MTKAAEYFMELIEKIPDAKAGKMFGALCMKMPNGKSAAMFCKERIVVKPPGDELQEALKLSGAPLFEPMRGRKRRLYIRLIIFLVFTERK